MDTGIVARKSGYLDRFVQIGIAQGRVLSVEFPTEPAEDAGEAHELLDRIEGYLEGVEADFSDVTVAMTMPTDQREVLTKVRTIPYGEQVSVEQLTGMVPGLDPTDESDHQDVREALAANPAGILIPTHRVPDGPSGLEPVVEQKLRSLEGL